MKRLLALVLVVLFTLLSPLFVFSQQFSLIELLEMTKSKKKFEQKMYSSGNTFISQENREPEYSYITYDENGNWIDY